MRSFITLFAMDVASIAWRVALAVFLVAVAAGLVYVLVRVGRTLAGVEKVLVDLDREMVPLLQKVGTTVDEVNLELDKVNEFTGTMVGMTQKVDATARAVENAVSAPAKKAAAFTAGVQQTFSSLVHRFRGGTTATESPWTTWESARTADSSVDESAASAAPQNAGAGEAGSAPEATAGSSTGSREAS